MFGHDKKDDDKDDNAVSVSTKPVNETLLGIHSSSDDDNQDDTSDVSSTDADEPDNEDEGTPVAVNQASTMSSHDSSLDNTDDNELLDIKRQALQELSPLVDHLDQTPEEKYKTTMMMIQASDDKSLIPTAYSAAKEIGDEKTRAQALLDIINEINYFIQKKV